MAATRRNTSSVVAFLLVLMATICSVMTITLRSTVGDAEISSSDSVRKSWITSLSAITLTAQTLSVRIGQMKS